MKNLLARGGIEFLAVLFGISGSLWVDDYRVGLINKEKSISTLNSLKDELIDDKEYFLNRHSMITDNNKILNLIIDNWGYNNSDSLIILKFERRNLMLRLRGYYAFHPPRTIYNSLSSDGSLALIPDYELKRKINLVFNGRTKHLIEGAENNILHGDSSSEALLLLLFYFENIEYSFVLYFHPYLHFENHSSLALILSFLELGCSCNLFSLAL